MSERRSYPGIDLLTGTRNPVVGGGRAAALIARNYSGRFLASMNGISVITEKPIKRVKPIKGGILLHVPGLVRAASVTGRLVVKPGTDAVLQEVKDAPRWIAMDTEDGIAFLPPGTHGDQVAYIRSAAPVRIMVEQAPKTE